MKIKFKTVLLSIDNGLFPNNAKFLSVSCFKTHTNFGNGCKNIITFPPYVNELFTICTIEDVLNCI